MDSVHSAPEVLGKRNVLLFHSMDLPFWGGVLTPTQIAIPTQLLDYWICFCCKCGCLDVLLEIKDEWSVNGLFHLLLIGVYWGYNPCTNLVLTAWNIQVCLKFWITAKVNHFQWTKREPLVLRQAHTWGIFHIKRIPLHKGFPRCCTSPHITKQSPNAT